MAKKIIVKVSWQYIPVSVLIVSKKNITTNFVVTFAYFLTRVQSVFFFFKKSFGFACARISQPSSPLIMNH